MNFKADITHTEENSLMKNDCCTINHSYEFVKPSLPKGPLLGLLASLN